MKKKLFSIFLLTLAITFSLINSQLPDDETPLEIGSDGKPKNVTSKNITAEAYTLPKEILEHYAEYHTLEEFNNTCTYETIFNGFTEKKLEEKIKRDNCIPNSKTLALILEAGWYNLTKFLVEEVYLKKAVDPTNIIFTYVRQFENSASKLKFLLGDLISYATLSPSYSYDNFDNNVKILIHIPDQSYILEYLSIYCYKDLFKVNSIFRSRNKFYRLVDSKNLFDIVDGECDYSYNSFSHQVEINIIKKNKLKKWTSLFK